MLLLFWVMVEVYQYYFERMSVWKDARNLVMYSYEITKEFPFDEEFHLKSQIRRSASSVKSNIAEGQGRWTKKDQARFTSIAFASLMELLNHLITAMDLGYISLIQLNDLRKEIDSIARQLNALKMKQEE